MRAKKVEVEGGAHRGGRGRRDDGANLKRFLSQHLLSHPWDYETMGQAGNNSSTAGRPVGAKRRPGLIMIFIRDPIHNSSSSNAALYSMMMLVAGSTLTTWDWVLGGGGQWSTKKQKKNHRRLLLLLTMMNLTGTGWDGTTLLVVLVDGCSIGQRSGRVAGSKQALAVRFSLIPHSIRFGRPNSILLLYYFYHCTFGSTVLDLFFLKSLTVVSLMDG